MKIPRMQWVVGALLFFATAVNYADRVAIGVVSVEIRKELTLDERDYSQIVTLFMIAYAIMYAASGPLIDRLGTRRGFAVFVFGWSLAQILHGLAIGKWSLGACRFLLGLCEPGNWPAAAKAVSEWFPAKRRALGIGVFNAGSSIGAAVAAPLVGGITFYYGWRAAFILTGMLGLVWLACFLILYQPPALCRWLRKEEYDKLKDEVAPPEQASARREPVDWMSILRNRGCYTLIIARFLTDPVVYFILFWLPEYLRKERGFDLAMVSRYAWVPYLFGGIGYIAGGWFSGMLMERGWTLERARKLVLIAGACIMPLGILAPMVPNAFLAIAVACCMTMGHSLWISNLLTLPTDMFRSNEVATASGFTGMGGAIGGALANLVTGYIVMKFSYAPIFWMAGIMHPLALGIVLVMLPSREFRNAR